MSHGRAKKSSEITENKELYSVPLRLEDLEKYARWVAYSGAPLPDGRIDKTPLNPRTGRAARNNDPCTWGTRREADKLARRLAKAGHAPGVGIQLGLIEGTDFALIGQDFDGCLGSESEVKPWAVPFKNDLDGYFETSPSQSGMKAFALIPADDFHDFKADYRFGSREKWSLGDHTGIELHLENTYFTVTGDQRSESDRLAHADYRDLKTLVTKADRLTGKKRRKTPVADREEGKDDFGLSRRDVRSIAREFAENNDIEKRDPWLKLGMALNDWFDDSEEGLSIWREVSRETAFYRRDPKHASRELEEQWESFGRDYGGDPITIASLIVDAPEWDFQRRLRDFPFEEFDDDADYQKHLRYHEREERADDTALLKPVSSFAGKRVPEREWLLANVIPHRQVTLLYGDGGTGKSLLALQVAAAVSTDTRFLGECIERPGSVCVIAAEDESDELHRRFADICRESRIDMSDLDRLFIRSVAGEESILAEATRNGSLKATEFYKRLDRLLAERQYSLLVLDTLSHLMAGNENDKNHATQFVNLLKHLAIKHNCAVLLLAHPSMNGMSSGTGTSGNTGWSNAARSRLYLERVKNEEGTEDDVDARVLRTMKSNYGPTGGEIRMTWQRGVFVTSADEEIGEDSRPPADGLFLDLLDTVAEQNRHVSHNPGPTYAPVVFAEHPKAKAKGMSKRTFVRAMERLLESGDVIVGEHGKGASKRAHLERVRRSQEPTFRTKRQRDREDLA